MDIIGCDLLSVIRNISNYLFFQMWVTLKQIKATKSAEFIYGWLHELQRK